MLMEVELTGMSFFAFHGCLEKEKKEGNEFLVDVGYSYDAGKAAESDDLRDAVDYSAVYSIVRREMETNSNLLDNVALRIKRSMESEIPGVRNVKVSVSKRNPPVGGPCEWSKVKFGL